MTRIDLRSGPGGGLSLPPSHLISDPEIVAALMVYEQAQADRARAHDEAFHFERTRPSAVEADAQALADALDAGDPDPGSSAVREFDTKLRDLKRAAEARDVVASRRLSELRSAFDGANVGEWVSELEIVREQRRLAWQEAIDHLMSTHHALAETEALLAFTRTGAFYPPGLLEAQEPGREVSLGQALTVLRRHGAPVPAVASVA